MNTNLLKPELDESIPPKFLAHIDVLLKKINLGDNWQKFYIYRFSLPIYMIGMTEYAVLYSKNVVYDLLAYWVASFLWCFILSNWSLTRKILAWFSVIISLGIIAWSIMIVVKIFSH
jgi:hypothetical protein